MRLHWEIEPKDINRVQALMAAQQGNPFVMDRMKRNIWDQPPAITKECFWDQMVACMLTSQQRSGPSSPVTRFVGSMVPDWGFCGW